MLARISILAAGVKTGNADQNQQKKRREKRLWARILYLFLAFSLSSLPLADAAAAGVAVVVGEEVGIDLAIIRDDQTQKRLKMGCG
jgi:hypothetical protein